MCGEKANDEAEEEEEENGDQVMAREKEGLRIFAKRAQGKWSMDSHVAVFPVPPILFRF